MIIIILIIIIISSSEIIRLSFVSMTDEDSARAANYA